MVEPFPQPPGLLDYYNDSVVFHVVVSMAELVAMMMIPLVVQQLCDGCRRMQMKQLHHYFVAA